MESQNRYNFSVIIVITNSTQNIDLEIRNKQ